MRAFVRARSSATRRFSTADVFGLGFLRAPSDFPQSARSARITCAPLVNFVSAEGVSPSPPSRARSRATVRTLDSISDALCRVVDAGEVARNLCAEHAWRSAADAACADLGAYIIELNGDRALYAALGRALRARPNITAEDAAFARSLRAEFERDGIARGTIARERIALLTAAAADAQAEFCYGGGSGADDAAVATAVVALRTSPRPRVRADALRTLSSLRASAVPALERLRIARAALATAISSRVPVGCYASLVARDRLARSPQDAAAFVVACVVALLPRAAEEFATVALAKAAAVVKNDAEGRWWRGKSGKGDAEVDDEFFESSASARRTCTLSAEMAPPPVRTLADAICEGAGARVTPYDVPYFSAAVTAGGDEVSAAACAYLSVDDALTGVALVFSRVFGVTVTRAAVPTEQAWAPQTAELVALHLSRDGTPVGTLFCDLFSRAGKPGGATHYVLRCGRSADDIDDVGDDSLHNDGSVGPRHGARGVVVVSTAFAPPAHGVFSASPSLRRALLSPREVETLFHEMGHAAHALLSATKTQHLSGYRGALDAVEIPAHIFEYWARDPRAVTAWARHAKTREPMPADLWARVRAARTAFRATELLENAVHSIFDIALFSAPSVARDILRMQPISDALTDGVGVSPADRAKEALERARVRVMGGGDSVNVRSPPAAAAAAFIFSAPFAIDDGTDVEQDIAVSPPVDGARAAATPELPSGALLRAVSDAVSLVPALPASTWAGSFTHAGTYGAGYYAYLVAEATAAAVWARHFQDDPWSREGGRALERLLAKGAAEEPADLLERLLGQRGVPVEDLVREVQGGA